MKKITLLLSFVFSAFAVISCEKEKKTYDDLIVQGIICNGLPPVITLQKGVPLNGTDEKSLMEAFAESVVTDGEITISDGTTTYKLIGVPDTTYSIGFVYTSMEFVGIPGKTYSLTATHNGQTVTATTTIPFPVEIKKIEFSAPNEEYRNVHLYWDGTDASEDYFAAFYHYPVYNEFIISVLGTKMQAQANQNDMTISVLRMKSLMETVDTTGTYAYSTNFKLGDQIVVRLAHLDKQSFAYWNALCTNFTQGMAFLTTYEKLKSNTSNNVGYFSGMGVCDRFVTITDSVDTQ
ncbi:MAG: DUF4249 family protein [Bacteroidales bacterium]|nr:DUF4249 family protein [Bacteroidales bacterium]